MRKLGSQNTWGYDSSGQVYERATIRQLALRSLSMSELAICHQLKLAARITSELSTNRPQRCISCICRPLLRRKLRVHVREIRSILGICRLLRWACEEHSRACKSAQRKQAEAAFHRFLRTGRAPNLHLANISIKPHRRQHKSSTASKNWAFRAVKLPG